jgi:negative regulator of genetic competence, sporulation and motility
LKIESDGEEKISVTLSKEDMHELDITYDEMDYSNIETRRVIWTILDEAKRILGKPIKTDGKLLIQVSPVEDGGCLLLFTPTPALESNSKKHLIMKKDAEPLLFRAFDSNALIDSIVLLKKTSQMLKAFEPFELHNKFYIIIYPKTTFSETIEFSLCEFGETEVGNKKGISELYEYGKPLLF